MARSESGFDLTPPSSRARKHLEADLTPEESEVLRRRGTARIARPKGPRVAVLYPGFVGEARRS